LNQRWVIALLAAVAVVLGWQTWSLTAKHRHQVEAAAQDLMMMANSAVFDANWALQQVQDPAAPESAALVRQAAEDLIIARERFGALREEAFRAAIPAADASELSDRAHVVALGLQSSLQSGQPELLYSYRNYLRVLTERLPFPGERMRDLASYSESAAAIRAIGQAEGFTLKAVPSAPPELQLVVAGSYSPVRRGG
jgi:hypothetical protein